jgi:ABC-type phosphate transport system ATPase subunit
MKELELTTSNRQMIIDNVDYGIQCGGKCVKFASATSKRTIEQNKKCHAMLGDISRQIKHYEQTYSVGVWKRLCMAAWLRERNELALMIPAIDGCGIEVIFEHTSSLGTKKMAEFIEWLYAYGTNSGVKWSKI